MDTKKLAKSARKAGEILTFLHSDGFEISHR